MSALHFCPGHAFFALIYERMADSLWAMACLGGAAGTHSDTAFHRIAVGVAPLWTRHAVDREK